jgi:6-phosphofructokinase 1
LASGADASYIFEEPFTVNDLIEDIRHLKCKMEGDLKRGLLIRNEMANRNYTSQFLQQLMSEEGKGVFSARLNILGHMQQGGVPSPFDRNLGIKLGAKALHRMIEIVDQQKAQLESSSSLDGGLIDSSDTVQVVGMIKNQILFTSIDYLMEETDFV